MAKNGDSAFQIARSIFTSDIWQDDPHLLKLWIYLIGNAVFKKNSSLYGTIDTSYRQIQEDNVFSTKKGKKRRWSLEKIKNMLEKLEKQGRIKCNRTPNGTHIIIVKYSDYQDLSQYKRTLNRTETEQQEKAEIIPILEEKITETEQEKIATSEMRNRCTEHPRQSQDKELVRVSEEGSGKIEEKQNTNRTPTPSKPLIKASSRAPNNGNNVSNSMYIINNIHTITTKSAIPDVEFCNLPPDKKRKCIDILVKMHFNKFPFSKSVDRKIKGRNAWIAYRVRTREYFEGLFQKYPTLSPKKIELAIMQAKSNKPWVYYPEERARNERYLTKEEIEKKFKGR